MIFLKSLEIQGGFSIINVSTIEWQDTGLLPLIILGQWFELKTKLQDRRYGSSSFENDNGVILMGGVYSNLVEILEEGESKLLGFNFTDLNDRYI